MNSDAVLSLIKKMEKDNILVEKEFTAPELLDQLLEFQKMLAKMVIGGKNLEEVRMGEIISKFESTAREKRLVNDSEIRRGIQALQKINKELNISIAGRNGESRVSNTLKYIKRPDFMTFKNVYIANEVKETELDTIILTNDGIVILEVKNSKTDITITEDGRLLYSNTECFHDTSICEKMKNKRFLLYENISRKIAKRGMDFNLIIDSYIVFSSPKDVRIKITDKCGKEKFCYRGSLPYLIDNYSRKEKYSSEQLEALKEIIGELESHKKKFKISTDFNQVRKDLAILLVKLFPEIYDISENDMVNERQLFGSCDFENDKDIVDKKHISFGRFVKSAACVAGIAVLPLVVKTATSLLGSGMAKGYRLRN